MALVVAIVAVLLGCSGGEPSSPAQESPEPKHLTDTAPAVAVQPGLSKEQRMAFEQLTASAHRAERDAGSLADDPRAVAEVRACGTGISGQLVITGEVRVGPLLLNFLASFGGNRGKYEPVAFEKVIVVIEHGHEATVVIGERHRRQAALLYTDSAAPAVTVRGCESARAVFNGGIIVAGDRCLPLDVYVDDAPRPLRVDASFGAGRCPT